MLLMPGDKKKMSSLIIASMKPDYVGKEKGGYEKEFSKKDMEEEGDDENYGLVACCEKIIESVKSGDAKALASYLSDAVELAKAETYE